MNVAETIAGSAYFAVLASLALYEAGAFLRKKLGRSWINPLVIAIGGTILVLAVSRVDYADYAAAAQPLSWLLTPATVCLAVPLYKRLSLLKKNWRAVMAGIAVGTLTSLTAILALALVFGLDHAQYATLLPKSVTTAIGAGISGELGGETTITVAVIILTGITGSVIAEPLCRLLRITDPVAQGVAIGSASHAIGTSRAMEMDRTAGAMSGLSIAVAGIMTVALAAVFSLAV